jgi:hypothetical protein
MYRARNGFSWVGLVKSINCDMTVILCPVHGAVSGYVSTKVKSCLTARRNIINSDYL